MRTLFVSPAAFPRSFRRVLTGSIAAALAGLLLAASPQAARAQTTGWNQTAGGTYDYNDPANWVGGNINGIWDPSLSLTGGQNVTFGADTSLTTGLDFSYSGGQNVTLRGTGGNFMLTLGGDILVNTVSTTRVINLGSSAVNQALNVDLGGVTRTFTVGSGRSLGFVNAVSNGSIVFSGGTLNFSGANTYSGATTVNGGNLSFNGASGSSVNSDVTANAGSGVPTVTFNSNSGSGTTRTKSVTLNGSGTSSGVALSVTGNAGANTVDSIANALAAPKGTATVGVAANASRSARLEAGSFVRGAGASVLFRGSDLGVSSVASQTAGDANIVFTSAPALTGANGTGTTLSILKGAIGEITTGGSGSTGGLVTYDAANGVRLLDFTTEYAATIADGQTQLDNVRFARASGDAAQDVNLTSALTTINSLSFRITGAGTNSGVTISGDAGTTLKLNSGTIFASQGVTTANATDTMLISVPTLDLNGQEGVISVFTNGVSNSNTVAPLRISSVIANDGGNGVTISGGGEVFFSGSEANTYTGVTTLNSGILRLDKSVANIGLTTDLVMNGGTLLKNSNAIADTASVTIHGGIFWMDNTSSSGNNGHTETVNNFTITGGSFGNHGSNAVLNINGNATISGSQLGMNQGGDITVLGTTTLNGGLLIARESSSTTTFNANTRLDDVAIVNPASDAYTAIRIDGHATNKGALLTLNGDVTFTGNATNANAAVIGSSDLGLANQGLIALDGVRAFNVGNGAAAVDLSIVPALVDGASAGGLTKGGEGTLELGGASTFTGATTVGAGTLLVSGSLSGSTTATVNSGGTIGGTGVIAGPVTVNSGGFLLGGNGTTASDDLSVSGDLNLLDGAIIKLTLGAGGAHSSLARTGGTWSFDLDQAFAFVDAGATATTYTDILTGLAFDPGTAAWTIVTPGFAGTFSYDAGTVDLTLTAVPEPSSLLTLLGGAGVLLGLRRRRVTAN